MTLEAYQETQIVEDIDIADFFLDLEGEPRDPKTWFFQSSSLGLGDNDPVPDRPYIVWNEFPDEEHMAVRETSNSRTRNFAYYVYDERGDFTKIEAIMRALKNRIKAMAPFTTDGGVRCSDSRWLGTSGQIPNDGNNCNAKFASVAYVVSE